MKDIKDETVDLIITDPPYKVTSRGNAGNSGGMAQDKQFMKGKVFAENDIEIEQWLPELYRVLKPMGHAYIMTNNKNIGHYLDVIDKSKFHFTKNLIWVKSNKIMGLYYMGQFEYIIFIHKGKAKKINNNGTSDVLQFPNAKTKDENGKNLHPTEKPIKMMEVLIENSSDENDVVLDPFMGVGTTGIAAVNNNRNFVGMELDQKYFNIAKKRIDVAENKIQGKLAGKILEETI